MDAEPEQKRSKPGMSALDTADWGSIHFLASYMVDQLEKGRQRYTSHAYLL